MKKWLFQLIFGSIAFAVLPSAMAAATEYAVGLGLRHNSVEAKDNGVSDDSKLSLQLGGLGLFDFGSPIKLRTGALFVRRNFELESGGTSVDFTFDYLDFPVTALYKFTDKAGAFAGMQVALNISDDCDGGGGNCDPKGTESILMPLVFGGHFRFQQNFALEVYYELGYQDIYDGAENLTAIGVNGFYFF